MMCVYHLQLYCSQYSIYCTLYCFIVPNARASMFVCFQNGAKIALILFIGFYRNIFGNNILTSNGNVYMEKPYYLARTSACHFCFGFTCVPLMCMCVCVCVRPSPNCSLVEKQSDTEREER